MTYNLTTNTDKDREMINEMLNFIELNLPTLKETKTNNTNTLKSIMQDIIKFWNTGLGATFNLDCPDDLSAFERVKKQLGIGHKKLVLSSQVKQISQVRKLSNP